MNEVSCSMPYNYRCGTCGATSVKLWRYWNNVRPLLCCNCAAKEVGEDINDIDERGLHTSKQGDKTDQIGGFIPAIPDRESGGYWSYTSFPNKMITWWEQLPTKP